MALYYNMGAGWDSFLKKNEKKRKEVWQLTVSTWQLAISIWLLSVGSSVPQEAREADRGEESRL
jgi:hypothetical protein